MTNRSKLHRHHCSISACIDIAKPIEEVFAFHQDLHNLAKVLPPFIYLKMATEHLLNSIDQKLSFDVFLLGLKFRTWHLRVLDFKPPHLIIDGENTLSNCFSHKHCFTAQTDRSTKVTDTVSLFLGEKLFWRCLSKALCYGIFPLLIIKLFSTKKFLEKHSSPY